jgi:adenylylsulfate kinase-like enzyme
MKTTLKRTITIFGILSMAFFFSAAKKVSPVNSDCPYSGKAVKTEKVLTFNVCCNNCVKKATKDVKGLIQKVKAGNKECPFSSKPAKKPVVVAFCCGNCVDKASS